MPMSLMTAAIFWLESTYNLFQQCGMIPFYKLTLLLGTTMLGELSHD